MWDALACDDSPLSTSITSRRSSSKLVCSIVTSVLDYTIGFGITQDLSRFTRISLGVTCASGKSEKYDSEHGVSDCMGLGCILPNWPSFWGCGYKNKLKSDFIKSAYIVNKVKYSTNQSRCIINLLWLQQYYKKELIHWNDSLNRQDVLWWNLKLPSLNGR